MKLAGWFLFALLVRLWVAVRTAVPDWDGVHYLWLAKRAAEGGPQGLFDTVFHPAYPGLVAVWLWLFPGLEPHVVAQGVGAVLGALAVIPLWFLARRAADGPARDSVASAACALYGLGVWFSRYPADCLSEGLFFPLVVTATLGVWRAAGSMGPVSRGTGWAAAAGALAGVAFAVRPEGLSLLAVGVPWLLAQRRVGAAAAMVLACAVPVGLVMWGWASWGPGWVLSSKLAFVYDEGVGRSPVAGGLGHYVSQLLKAPGATAEALGVGFPLALVGLWVRRVPIGIRWLLLGPLAIQWLVAPALKSHSRFFVSYGVLLLPFAGCAMVWLWGVLPKTWMRVALVLLLVLPDGVRLPQARRHNRIVEQQVGAFLLGQGIEEGELFTDMPRVAYFAGLRPTPPRAWRLGEAQDWAARPAVRWLAFVRGRTELEEVELSRLGYVRREPDGIAAAMGRRRLELWVRPR